jgi:hypothetical protein
MPAAAGPAPHLAPRQGAARGGVGHPGLKVGAHTPHS